MTQTPQVSRIEKWRQTQEAIGSASEKLFDLHAGKEIEVFGSACALIHNCFAAAEKCGTPKQRTAMVALAQAYQQLLSSWEDLRRGRLTASMAHWRSLWESPEYISACAIDNEFAHTWGDLSRRRTVKPEKARRVMCRWMNDREAGLGDKWRLKRIEQESQLRSFSHVSAPAALQATLGAVGGRFIVAEAAYAPRLRFAALYIALRAKDILVAAGFAFADLLDGEWNSEFDMLVVGAEATLDAESTNLLKRLEETQVPA